MTAFLVCWKCGHDISALPMPLGRLAQCPGCHAELHVCRMCEFYEPKIAEQCREPVADYVKDKQRANFCDYFKPIPGAWQPVNKSGSIESRSRLDALFGIDKKPDDKKEGLTEAEKARTKLDDLFK